jgi:hypothetical protein
MKSALFEQANVAVNTILTDRRCPFCFQNTFTYAVYTSYSCVLNTILRLASKSNERNL